MTKSDKTKLIVGVCVFGAAMFGMNALLAYQRKKKKEEEANLFNPGPSYHAPPPTLESKIAAYVSLFYDYIK